MDVTTKEYDWLAECQKADKELYEDVVVYEFSSGRKFKEDPQETDE